MSDTQIASTFPLHKDEQITGEVTKLPVPPRFKSFLWWVPYLILASAVFVVGVLGYQSDRRHDKAIEGLSVQVRAVRAELGQRMDEDRIFLKILVLKSNIDHDLARTIARTVHENARAFKRDPDFILAIMSQESDFDPNAVSPAKAVGLMQIMPEWLDIVGREEDLTRPEVSVRWGIQVYTYYEKEFGNDREKALTAYNRGSGPVWRDMTQNREWRNGYAKKVMTKYEFLKRLSNSP